MRPLPRWPFVGPGSPLGLAVPPRRIRPLHSKLAVWIAAAVLGWALLGLIAWATVALIAWAVRRI